MILEYVVTLHGDNEVVTAYPSDQQAQAMAMWKRYIEHGKFASLTVR